MLEKTMIKLGSFLTFLTMATAAFAQRGGPGGPGSPSGPGCGPPIDVPEINGASQAIAAALFIGGALIYYERKRRLAQSKT